MYSSGSLRPASDSSSTIPKLYRRSRELLATLKVDIPSVRVSAGDLSGGQRQAVALARAMAKNAEIILMDEPTAALGVRQTAVVNELIRELSAAGKTVVVISHNLEEIFRVADTIVVLRLGRCVGVRQAEGVSREEIVGLITGAVAPSPGTDQLTKTAVVCPEPPAADVAARSCGRVVAPLMRRSPGRSLRRSPIRSAPGSVAWPTSC